jgi:hypothetical protein
MISTNFNIDKYQYLGLTCDPDSRTGKGISMMDQDTNVAAWMIANGLRSSDPATDRNRQHLRALNASRPAPVRLMSRLAAAIGSFRSAGTTADAECCPA